jgi:hypothetical protein
LRVKKNTHALVVFAVRPDRHPTLPVRVCGVEVEASRRPLANALIHAAKIAADYFSLHDKQEGAVSPEDLEIERAELPHTPNPYDPFWEAIMETNRKKVAAALTEIVGPKPTLEKPYPYPTRVQTTDTLTPDWLRTAAIHALRAVWEAPVVLVCETRGGHWALVPQEWLEEPERHGFVPTTLNYRKAMIFNDALLKQVGRATDDELAAFIIPIRQHKEK